VGISRRRRTEEEEHRRDRRMVVVGSGIGPADFVGEGSAALHQDRIEELGRKEIGSVGKVSLVEDNHLGFGEVGDLDRSSLGCWTC